MESIKEFLTLSGSGYGSGYGYGDGSGRGSGYGSGSGSWIGNGSGAGDGYGSGAGAGDGSGSGYGSGSGSGSGYGYGSGRGSGDGSGSGSGYGYGHGFGSGSVSGLFRGIKSFCGQFVYNIDSVNTMIDRIRSRNVASGKILHDDLTTEKCVIVKSGSTFAHGKNLRAAMQALRDKLFEEMPEADRIAAFIQSHTLSRSYPCRDLYDWHNKLTGSCEFGRKAFARDHEIDVDRDSMTVKQFIDLTRDAYGGDVIRRLEQAYKEI